MALRTISRTDLARRTREVLTAVRQGHPAMVQSYGEDQAVLLDALDFRLLCGVATWAAVRLGAVSEDQQEISGVVLDYLDEKISLGKAAELLGVSRFELIDRFRRLRVPLRIGPASLEEAQAEVEVARRAAPAG